MEDDCFTFGFEVAGLIVVTFGDNIEEVFRLVVEDNLEADFGRTLVVVVDEDDVFDEGRVDPVVRFV